MEVDVRNFEVLIGAWLGALGVALILMAVACDEPTAKGVEDSLDVPAVEVDDADADESEASDWGLDSDGEDVSDTVPDAVVDVAPDVEDSHDGSDVADAPCVPTWSCEEAGAECGSVDDGCGELLDCGGSCALSETCGGGGVANRCGCTPATCAALGVACGSVANGCGGVLHCGDPCVWPETCGGAGEDNQCGCTPLSCAAAEAECGQLPDGCGGELACGSCEAPLICGGAGANRCGDAPCTPKTCVELGAACGSVGDGCGATLNCGSCTLPQTCGGGGVANQCGCTPKSCTALAAQCGEHPDGCGGTVDCGGCTLPQTCGGGGVANQCGCTPTTCTAEGAGCGSIPDGCGGTLSCGGCTLPQTCGGGGVANQCGCTPTSCTAAGAECGTIDDGCGGTLSCGGCTLPQTCGGGGTANQCGCTPTSCTAAGAECGTIADGCGGTLPCGLCTPPLICGGQQPNRCGDAPCTPKTCVELGAACGSVGDGCGATLNCGGCTLPQTCGGGGVANQCGCTPTTCAEAGAQCGTLADGCGATLTCADLCGANEVCDGANRCQCATGFHRCSGVCVANDSVATCGTRCTPCPTVANGTATCNGVSCGIACDPDYHLCSGQCRWDYAVASCGTRCSPCPTDPNGTATCDGVSCGMACNADYHLCSGTCRSDFSPATCGTRCAPCPTDPNGTATCDGVSCGMGCNATYHHCTPSTCCAWSAMELPFAAHSGDDFGRYSAIAVHSASGRPRIAFQDFVNTGSNVHYATFDGLSWSFENVDVATDWNAGEYVALALTEDVPHIAYPSSSTGMGGRRLRYATKVGTTWSVEDIHTLPYSSDHFVWRYAIAMRGGTPWVLYGLNRWDATASQFFIDMVVAYKSGATWVREVVATESVNSRPMAMSISSDGRVHVLLRSWTSSPSLYHLRYAVRAVDGTWSTETLLSGNPNGGALVLDAANQAHVVFLDDSGRLQHATRVGGVWVFDALGVTNPTIVHDIAINQAGQPVVAYAEKSGSGSIIRLRVAVRKAVGEWAVEAVNPSLDYPFGLDLVMHGSRPHISYYNGNTFKGWYATAQ